MSVTVYYIYVSMLTQKDFYNSDVKKAYYKNMNGIIRFMAKQGKLTCSGR